jgi:hypothetical protein
MVLVGAAIVLLLASFPTPLSSLGPEGAAASVGLLLWVAAADGRGRPGSIVGAVGTLGLLVVEPLVRRVLKPPRRRARRPENHLATVALVTLAQGALALYAARVAGFEDDGGRAALLLVPMVVAAVLIAPVVPRPRSRAPRRRRREPPPHEPARHRRVR